MGNDWSGRTLTTNLGQEEANLWATETYGAFHRSFFLTASCASISLLLFHVHFISFYDRILPEPKFRRVTDGASFWRLPKTKVILKIGNPPTSLCLCHTFLSSVSFFQQPNPIWYSDHLLALSAEPTSVVNYALCMILNTFWLSYSRAWS